MVMAFVVPALIATILGWLDANAASPTHSKIPFLYVDLDRSNSSTALLDRLKASESVAPMPATLDEARQQVRTGSALAAVVVPKGFGADSAKSMSGGQKAKIELLSDPSKVTEVETVKGTLMGEASAVAAIAAYGPLAGIENAPVEIAEVPSAAKPITWGASAHDYAGFGMQGLLFFAIEAAIGLSRERRLGIWRRLKASPVPPSFMLLAKGISAAVMALLILACILGLGASLFGIRILGSSLGFLALLLCSAAMTATFGLLVSTIGRSETQSRGISILIILVMLATGGAWFPMSQMPRFVQKAAEFLPVRWVVEGLDAMTWRGLGFASILPNLAALVGFTIAFSVLAILRFRVQIESD